MLAGVVRYPLQPGLVHDLDALEVSGWVLQAVVVIVAFMLIELMLIDSARELKEAQRFRSRMVAMASC